MTTRNYVLASTLLAALSVIPASAQTRDAPGRYTMQPVEGGFLRLDTQTGAVAMCRPGPAGAVNCVPSEREPDIATEVQRLRAENTELKARVRQLEQAAAPGTVPPHDEKLQLPTEQEVDQALDYVERMYKKFRDRLRNLDSGAPKSGTPL